MQGGKQYGSVGEMLGDLYGPEERADFEDSLASRRLGKALFILASLQNLSLTEIARQAGHNEAWVERIEKARDDELTLQDVRDYVCALVDLKPMCHVYKEFHRPAMKYRDQLNLLREKLLTWLEGHKEAVAGAFVTNRPKGLMFVIVQKSCEHDAAFDDEVSALDVKIANDPDLPLIRMDAIAVPFAGNEALASLIGDEAVNLM